MAADPSRWELEVAGLTCDRCERHVSRAIGQAGGTEVAASWRDGRARFTAADPDADAMAAVVSEAGYRPGRLRLVDAATDVAPVAATAGVGRGGRGEWDLAIIGAGSAAFAAAIRATEAGARVVMIERGTLGGTCVNVGCVPSKALLAAANAYHRARRHGFAGVPSLDGSGLDLAALVAQKDELVAALRHAKYLDLVEAYGFELRRGTARFVGPDTIEVDGEPLSAAAYLIATGARPALPPIDGLAAVDYLTSTSALELTEVPRSLAVIGANAVGLELGQYFLHLGSEVTFLDVAERIAPSEEPEISAALTEILVADGAHVLTGAHITRAAATDGGVVLEGALGDASSVQAERLLVATGRAANTAELDLAAAGVATDRRGFVAVDGQLRTSNPRVWAAGDVTASPQFVYVAAAEGALAADNAVGAAGRALDDRAVPRVTFTTPQIAAVGSGEAEARQAGHDPVVSVLPLEHVPRALVDRDTRGLVKLVADRATDRLVGVHLLADGAGDMIQAGVYALLVGMTTAEMAAAYHPYLTMAEGLKLAAQAFDRDVTQLSCCAA